MEFVKSITIAIPRQNDTHKESHSPVQHIHLAAYNFFLKHRTRMTTTSLDSHEQSVFEGKRMFKLISFKT